MNTDEQRILQSGWRTLHLTYKSWNRIFQTWGLQRKTKNCNVFNFSLPPEKGNDKAFQKLYKKTCFPNILGLRSKCFSGKSTSTTYFLTRFLLLYEISEKKPNKWILRKVVTEGWTEGWIDPQYHTFRESIIISIIQDLLLC